MATNAGVLFDIDGTLLDTNYLHVLAWWQGFRDNDHTVSMWTLHRAIGIGSEELVERALGEPDEDVVQAHSERYEALRDQVTAFPKAAELLSACADRGLTVVLATSGAKDDLDWMLPAIGAPDGVIAGTMTSADVDAAKPHPDLLEVAVRDHGVDPARTVAVGDTVYDVQAAKSAGLPCVALRCGGSARTTSATRPPCMTTQPRCWTRSTPHRSAGSIEPSAAGPSAAGQTRDEPVVSA